MAKAVMIIGLGRFGSSVAHTLFQLGYDVLGIDTDEKVVQANLGQITYSVQGDATNETTLRELGVSNFEAAIVAVGSDMQASLMTAVLLDTLGVRHHHRHHRYPNRRRHRRRNRTLRENRRGQGERPQPMPRP